LQESELSEEDNEKYSKINEEPAKVVTKIVGEDEWGEYDYIKRDNAILATAHSRTASASNSFLPLNHR
jgi:hypothetical protein